ncbi:MAG: TonB-dependent receptor [Bacteroidales bacterium]|nr:TonB-dependent receptor [Bacteroidales bacterium]
MYKSILLLVFSGWVFLGFGQQLSISGIVTDSVSGNPLTGAHIVLEGSKFGAISDYRGHYIIYGVQAGEYVIKVTFIGFDPCMRQITLSSTPAEADFNLKPGPVLAEEAVITANRTNVSRNLVPITVSIINRQTLEEDNSSNLLPVVSKQVPGAFVTERGISGFGVADGAAGQISIRGIGGSPNTRVLVLIDGHPQFMGIFGHPLPDAYAASDAEKVEVVRGPASILYGSNAMGGVINIITREQAKDGISVQGKLGYGSFNTLKVNAGVGVRVKKMQAFVSYNKDKTDGHRKNSDFNMDNFYAKLSYDINSHFKILADAGYARYEATNPGPVNTSDTTFLNPTHFQAIERAYASTTMENKYRKTEGALKAYINWGEHDLAYDSFLSSDHNYGIMFYQAMKLFDGNTITAGLDYANYGGYAYNTSPFEPVKIIDTAVAETGGYVLVQQQVLKKLLITAGIRLHYHTLFGSEWIPQAGVSYSMNETTSAKVNISKGFRSPTIRELFMFKPANPELKPERMWNYEAGLNKRFLDMKLSAELTGFFASGDNLIETVGQFPDILNRNTGSFEHYGIEFQGKYIMMRNFDLLMNYSWLHTGKPTLAAPEHQVYLQGRYGTQGFRFQLAIQYINNLVIQTNPATGLSYLTISARVSYTVKDFVTFYLNGENLTDQRYEINYGYPMPGITVMGGIVVKKVFDI